VKKLLSAFVMAGLLAGLGCGGDTGTGKDKKDAMKKEEKDKKDAGKPSDTRKDLP
jgi:hypothetical protein